MLFFLSMAFAQDPYLPAVESLRVIDTAQFELVYPKSAEALAQRSAAALDTMMREIYKERRDGSISKIYLTLNNHNPNAGVDLNLFPIGGTISAGLSNNHPFRQGHASSWLETSMFDVAWKNVQYERSFYGGAILYWLFMGDTAWETTHNFSQPRWFLEGEKRFYSRLWMGSASVMPRQKSRLAAYLEAAESPSFHQLTIGSNRRFLPDIEETGMLFVNYGLSDYSNNLWSISVPYAVSNWYGVHSFETAIMRYGPTTFERIYEGSTERLSKEWAKGLENRYENKSIPLLPPAPIKSFNHHQLPQRGMDGSLYFIQDSLTDTGSIMVSSDPWSKPKRVVRLGQRNDIHFDEHGGYLLWAEQKHDLMWRNKASQDLFLFDTSNKRKYRLSRGEIVYNPVFSPDGEYIALFSRDKGGHISIEIRSNTGEQQKTHQLDVGDHFDLSWRDTNLCWVHKSIDEGNRILCTDMELSTPRVRLDWTWTSISNPLSYKDYLLFVSSVSTGEELHAWDGIQQYRIAASTYGVLHPFIDEERMEILLSEYRDSGQTLIRIPLSEKLWEPIQTPKEKHPTPPEYTIFNSRPYGRWNGLFRIHSWSPGYNASNGAYELGVQSGNLRDTLALELTGMWDSVNETTSSRISSTYREFWPEITADMEMGSRSRIITPEIFGLGEASSISWTTQRFGGSVSLPLYMQEGPFQGKTTFSLSGHQESNENHKYTNITISPEELGIPSSEQLSFSVGIESRFLQDTAQAQLAPPMGYDARLQFQQVLDGNSGVYLDGQFWLPSLFPTHSIGIRTGYTSLPFHEDAASLVPIGTTNRVFESLGYIDARYSFPIAHPDFAMDGWLYLRRIRGSVFVQHAVRDDNSIDAMGVSIDLDAHLLRYTLPLSRFGLDIAYHQRRGQIVIQPKFSIYEF